jgi:predicted helicase
MSKIAIHQYYQNLDRTLQFGKSTNEQSIRHNFLALLNDYARKYNYEVVPEISILGTTGKKIRPDAVVKNLWGLDIGYWESKDEQTDIHAEIDAKIRQGYPLTNILFEDTRTAVLYQKGVEVKRVAMREAEELHQILTDFFTFKSETVDKFEEAIEKFKADIPAIVAKLRAKIDESGQVNVTFSTAQHVFLKLCKREINPNITLADIREMLIQHLLTSDIFTKIFDDAEFHQHNTIAAELEKLVGSLFAYAERRNLLHSIEHYYQAINATAAAIIDHHEKQKFLKVLYENFYKVYNPKAADRLGVVYTPNEIVQFMVRSTNYLLEKHFGKTLADQNVEILDPATGTGTFICEIIENAIPKQHLEYKFANEIYANEVAILPYYIANLNIEYTFKQKMDCYAEFPNLCFVDTLDNVGALSYRGKNHDFFGLTSENTQRIKRQNEQIISVIIGNPPYNANQMNENENNKNREYPIIDKRIKETYVEHSTAQKTKVYDMYARFLRWASDRIDNNGIIAFVSNSSFIDSKTYDGFRKCVADEFNEVHLIDLKGNARTSGERRRQEGGNVFSDEIRVGVAVYFLVKNEKAHGCKIYYHAISDYTKADEKKAYLRDRKLSELDFERITPDKNHNWINLAAENDWESLLPVCSKEVKAGKNKEAIFELFSNGVVTARDEWVYDFDPDNLLEKLAFFGQIYNHQVTNASIKNAVDNSIDYQIKWSESLKNSLHSKKRFNLDRSKLVFAFYKPFTKKCYYYDSLLSDRLTGHHFGIFGNHGEHLNRVILFNNRSSIFKCLSTKYIYEFGSLLDGGGQTVGIPLYRYDDEGQRFENITTWGLEQFRAHYQDQKISKKAIFHYTYAVLHNPAYRQKYELNLKREFPRLPFYPDFGQWVAWGKVLMDLHINYEKAKKYPLKRQDLTGLKNLSGLKVKLKADKLVGTIEIDEQTTLHGIPEVAWEYQLGNRSALEWILDQYKEKKPSDPTIAEQFNTYRFADYKEQVIELLQRVCTVSVRTVEIIKQMGNE